MAKIMENHDTHGWLIAAFLREMLGLEGKAKFECVESSFVFNRCLRQESVEAPRLWQKMATQLLATVEKGWIKERMGILMDFECEKAHQKCSFMWADNFWIISHTEQNLEQMLRDLIEEASRWDLVHKPASLWWTSTYDSEERCDFSTCTTSGCHKFPFEERFKILGYALNRRGKTHDAIEERMSSANKAFCKDILIYESKDVPWKMKCRRLVDHV